MNSNAEPSLTDLAVRLCRDLLGFDAAVLDSPGRRSVVRLRGPDGDLIVTRRRSAGRTRLEGEVLRALHRRGAPVPRLLGYRDTMLIQEDLGSPRLSQRLAEGDDRPALLDAALTSLARIHRAGLDAGLDRMVAAIGSSREWKLELASLPLRIAERLDLPTPPFDPEAAADRLQVRRPALIKWDARPGNAVARPNGVVGWFDWEHCGVRDRLDDVAWLLADEYVPDDPAAETALLGRHLREFAFGRSADDAADYLATFAVLHVCVRLGLALHYKADGPWWDRDACLAGDKVGVRPEWADGLAARGMRWSERSRCMARMVPWFEAARARIREL